MDTYRLHFYRPLRIWERVLCWLLGQHFKHVNIEFADGSEWLLDCPKRGLTKVYKSGDFLAGAKPDLSVTASGVTYGSAYWVRAVALFRDKRLHWWATLGYLLQLRGAVPENCASLVSHFFGDVPIGTPDQLLEYLYERQSYRVACYRTATSGCSPRLDSRLTATTQKRYHSRVRLQRPFLLRWYGRCAN